MHRPNNYRVQARDAERYFPVRIRIARDWLGRDHEFEKICWWLDAQIGPGRYWHVGERSPPFPDTILFYFVAIADAQAFIDRFSCGVWIAGEWPNGHAAITDENDMRWIGHLHKT